MKVHLAGKTREGNQVNILSSSVEAVSQVKGVRCKRLTIGTTAENQQDIDDLIEALLIARECFGPDRIPIADARRKKVSR